MAKISTAQIKELRDLTGAGIMDSKAGARRCRRRHQAGNCGANGEGIGRGR